MRKKLLVANWKMNLPKEGIGTFVDRLAAGHPAVVELGIAPPFPFIEQLRVAIERAKARVATGAQNCSTERSGAFTGEVAADMLAAVGVKSILAGHSERRKLYGEDDATVGRKIKAISEAGLSPLFCIGETLEEREGNRTSDVLARQVSVALEAAGPIATELVVAYEPVWAIGTGRNASPEMAADAHRTIRGLLAKLGQDDVSILYGGSVTPDNAAALSAEREIDGFLVGGASLESGRFLAIGEALAKR
jgi:triosephosphate isomerase